MMIMNKNTGTLISLTLTLLGMVACSPSTPQNSQNNIPEATQPPAVEKTIVLADISDNPQKKIRRFQPLANHIAANTQEFDRGKVKVAPDMDTMIAWLQSGEVDIYIDSPYPTMLAMNSTEAKPILRRWKKGTGEYYSVIFTMKDRNIKSLSDLKGKIIAFEDPVSTTGYMLPLAKLLESGLNAIEKSTSNSQVSQQDVGYVFSYEDENSLEWLLSGKIAAVATDNKSFDKLSAEIKEKTLILGQTEKVARNLVMVNKNMSPEQINAISSILLAMDGTDEGKAILEQFGKTTKFDELPKSQSLDKIQALYQKYPQLQSK